MFNPFAPPGAQNPDNSKRDEMVRQMSQYFLTTAQKMAELNSPDRAVFQSQAGVDWILDEIQKIEEIDDLDDESTARAAALYFMLLTTGAQ